MSSVKGESDAHILFTGGVEDSNEYEIVIGGWNNGQSVIRRSKGGPNLVEVKVDTYYILATLLYDYILDTGDSFSN